MFENMTRNLSQTIQIKDTKLKCYLEEHVWQKMTGWCNAAKSEVSGMGLCKTIKGGFVVYDVFFPKQYGSSGYTELDDRALAKLQIELYNKKIPAEHFRFWWHTHYNFNVFWSGTDDGNATTLAKANGEWELSVVINQSGEYRCRADFFSKPHRMIDEKMHVLVDNIEVMTCKNSKKQGRNPRYKADVKRFVKPMSELPEKQKPKVMECTVNTPPPTHSHNHDYSGGYGHGGWWDFEDDAKPAYSDNKSEGMSFFNGKTGQWEAYQKKDDKQENCSKCGSRFCKDGYICEAGWKGKASEDKPKEKRYFELENGDAYGGYIYYESRLLDPKVYREMMAEMEAKIISSQSYESTTTKDICPCRQEDCVNQELCVHCDLCQGRMRALDGYCEDCYDIYVKNEGGVSGKKSESSEVTQ